MRGSVQKDLGVYDFNAEDEAVEAASGKFLSRLRSRLSPKIGEALSKYNFLRAFTSSLNLKQGDTTNILSTDVHDSAAGSYATDTMEKDLGSVEETLKLEELVVSSTNYNDCPHTCQDDSEFGTLVGADPPAVEDSSIALPFTGGKLLTELPTNGKSVDVISDDDRSWTLTSRSPPTTASDFAEDEGYTEYPKPICSYSAFNEMENIDVAVVIYPEYVRYGNALYGESQLTFFSDCIKGECSDAHGSDKKVFLEWVIADVINIDCCWSGSVEVALVNLRLRAIADSGDEKVHDAADIVNLTFAANGKHWLEKEQKIVSLSPRYKDIWNVLPNHDLKSEEGTVLLDMPLSKDYFTETVEPFGDVVYPKGDPDAVSISKRDLELLQPDTFVNDTIIDFYIKFLKTKIQSNDSHRFHFFNSFFFRKLADLDKDALEGRAAFQRVRKWTRKVDILKKDYIFIPVNFNLHWSLLVVCHPGEIAASKGDDIMVSPKVPCVLHMDSIKGSHSGLKNIVQSYLWEEWKERHPESSEDNSSNFLNLRFVSLEVPQQENSFDCGLFLLHYVELFLEEALVNFNLFKISNFSSFLNVDWFPPAEASLKRTSIRRLIYEILKDSCQKVATTMCRNRHHTAGFPETDIKRKPNVKFLPQECNAARTDFADLADSITDQGIEIELFTMSHAQCDQEEGFVPHDFLEPGADAGSDPHSQVHSFQNIKCTKSSVKACADENGQFVSSTIERDARHLQGRSSTAQICSTSFSPAAQVCPTSYSFKDIGTCETSSSFSQEERGVDVDSLNTSSNGDDMDQYQKEIIKRAGSVSSQNCGSVSASPDSASSGKMESNVEDSQDIDTIKLEKGAGEDSQRINTNQVDERACDNSQVCSTPEVEHRTCEDSQDIDSARSEHGEDYQETDREGEGSKNDEDCQEIGPNKLEDENHRDFLEINSSECGDCSVACPLAQESLPLLTCQDVSAAGSENSGKVDVRLMKRTDELGTVVERQPHKRQKVVHSYRRMCTRSFPKDP